MLKFSLTTSPSLCGPRPKLIRVTTVAGSLRVFLKGQLKYLTQSFEVIGLASGKEILEEVSKSDDIRTIDVKMVREISLLQDLKSLYNLIKIFRQERPEIVHANTPKASLLSMIAARLTRVPHRLYTVTGLRFETTSGFFRVLLKSMERITCLCATKVIPEGEGVKKTLIREKITCKPLEVVRYGNIAGIDLNYYNRENLGKVERDEKFAFIFVGRLVRDKGINELITAFQWLNNQYSATKLFLLGSFEPNLDPVLPATEEVIRKCPGIEYVGYQKDVRPFFAISDVLVFPSYREGFPNVVLQAGAMGLPSIVTDINGCNEIVISGQNGIIIPKANKEALYEAMLWSYNNREGLLKKMAEQARPMIASRYEQKDVWDALLKMYQSLNTNGIV